MTTIRGWLAGIANLQQIGRNGLHRYNNSDHSMLTALRAVDNACAGASHDLWAVNGDGEYHEEARVPEQPYRDAPATPALLADDELSVSGQADGANAPLAVTREQPAGGAHVVAQAGRCLQADDERAGAARRLAEAHDVRERHAELPGQRRCARARRSSPGARSAAAPRGRRPCERAARRRSCESLMRAAVRQASGTPATRCGQPGQGDDQAERHGAERPGANPRGRASSAARPTPPSTATIAAAGATKRGSPGNPSRVIAATSAIHASAPAASTRAAPRTLARRRGTPAARRPRRGSTAAHHSASAGLLVPRWARSVPPPPAPSRSGASHSAGTASAAATANRRARGSARATTRRRRRSAAARPPVARARPAPPSDERRADVAGERRPHGAEDERDEQRLGHPAGDLARPRGHVVEEQREDDRRERRRGEPQRAGTGRPSGGRRARRRARTTAATPRARARATAAARHRRRATAARRRGRAAASTTGPLVVSRPRSASSRPQTSHAHAS